MSKNSKETNKKEESVQEEPITYSDKEVKKIEKEAKELMEYFLEAFEVDVSVDYEMHSYSDEEGVQKHFFKIEIDGEDLGVLIGYRGRNLRSLQRVFMMILNRRLNDVLGEERFIRIVIDVAGYRDGRKESLQDMAERIRREVVESGEPVDMPAMTSYERRVIHVHLDHFSDVTTESFGKGSDRYVTVLPVASSESDEDDEAGGGDSITEEDAEAGADESTNSEDEADKVEFDLDAEEDLDL
jgi:spoIIIJ-associated protein